MTLSHVTSMYWARHQMNYNTQDPLLEHVEGVHHHPNQKNNSPIPMSSFSLRTNIIDELPQFLIQPCIRYGSVSGNFFPYR